MPRHPLEREEITPEMMEDIPDAIPDEKGRILFAAWGKVSGEGNGSHVIQDGKRLCSGERVPSSEPTIYAYLEKQYLNPRVRVHCKLCNQIIEKFSLT